MAELRAPRKRTTKVKQPPWWAPSWEVGSDNDPDRATSDASVPDETWHEADEPIQLSDEAILAPLEAEFGQVRSKERVRDLAEVFTHQREVDAILDLMPDAFGAIDIKFLEPACGSGNFLVEILRRKLRLVSKHDCTSQGQYEYRLLRVAASIYGVDISLENITEARARMAHALLSHYQSDANTIEPTPGFLHAAALILGANIVVGDTLNKAHEIELCDWQPRPHERFLRVWTHALIPRDPFTFAYPSQHDDAEPVHYAAMTSPGAKSQPPGRRNRGTAK